MTVRQAPLTFAERAVLAVLASQGPLSAREIRRWSATHLDLLVWRPRLTEIYAVLTDLERSAYVRGQVEHLDDVRRTRAFRLTDDGRQALRHAVVRSLLGYAGAGVARRSKGGGPRIRGRQEQACDEFTVAHLAVGAESASPRRADDSHLLSERLRTAGLIWVREMTTRPQAKGSKHA